ncbi:MULTISPECIES: hypothetical protein [Sinorhizobium]|nr:MULTISPECIES: hypothetical protein [Sinorhizobium]
MIDLSDDVERGIQIFMAEQGISRETAILLILEDWLKGHSLLPLDADEDD